MFLRPALARWSLWHERRANTNSSSLASAYMFENDDYFAVPDWKLDVSWILCTISASVAALLTMILSPRVLLKKTWLSDGRACCPEVWPSVRFR